MRFTIRECLVAACYGLWAGLCAVASFAIIGALWMGILHSTRNTTFRDLIEFLPYAVSTAIVAALGWMIIHLRSRRPSLGAFIALAISIVIVVHLVLVSQASVHAPPGPFFMPALILFLFHFWLTVPIAIGATGLFVWCLRRWSVL